MELKDFQLIFYGHGVFPFGLLANIGLAFAPAFYLYKVLEKQEEGSKRKLVFWLYVWLMLLPNSMYLFMEFRHILFQDGVADNWELPAVLVFGLLSIMGFVLSIFHNYQAVTKINFLKSQKALSIIILSFMATWGAVLGVADMISLFGIVFPPAIIFWSVNAFSMDRLIFTLIIGSVLSVLSLSCLKLFPKEGA